MKIIKFVKEDNIWYADLPDYPGRKGDLMMVAGTDKLLDELCPDENSIILKVSDKRFDDAMQITKLFGIGYGATYVTRGKLKSRTLWLCPVLKFVFDKYPRNIYFDIVM
jgi:hypothetical protein